MGKAQNDKDASRKRTGILELTIEQIAERLRREVTKAGAPLVKFMGLVASFEKEIPEEGKRINAAIKAMEHAAGLSKEDIFAAADSQRAEIQKQKKLFSQGLAAKKKELDSAADRAGELKVRVDGLKKELASLEAEEKKAREEAARGDEMLKESDTRMATAAKALDEEVAGLRDKIEHYSKNPESAPPSEDSVQSLVSSLDLDVTGTDAGEDAQDSSGEKRTCPHCGGEMAWYEIYEKWGCYSCGHQEE
jgi:chromosome segregation ATPase